MTAIVGVNCTDGVVIGTDSSATLGSSSQFRTIEQQYEKIHIIGERIIVACTGEIGYGQRFTAIVDKLYGNNHFAADKPPLEVGKMLAREMIQDLGSTFIQAGGGLGALVAFPLGYKHHLCEFQLKNFQPELKDERLWYGSLGSGENITDPFLGFIREVYWKAGRPSVQEGIFAVTWTLDHTIELNTGGINGPANISVLENVKKGQLAARILTKSDLDETRQMIEAAKNSLRELPLKLKPSSSTQDVPKPRS